MKLLFKKEHNWFIILLLFFFISESIYKLLLSFDLNKFRISGFTKFFFQVLMFYVILKNHKRIKIELMLLILISLLYLLGQMILRSSLNFIEGVEYLNNALFTIITLLFFKTLNLSSDQKTKALFYYERILIINSIAIIIGFIFSITYFKTYSIRFGYNGFLHKPSFASYFYLIGVFYYSLKVFVYKEEKLIKFILIVLAAVLTGTKASLLSVLLVFLFLIIKLRIYKNKLFASSILFSLSFAWSFKETLIGFFMRTSVTFAPIINEKGIVTALFSFRNLILKENLIPFVQKEWHIGNYLFGGIGDIIYKCGFDLLDLIYFFGIIGGIIYIDLLNKTFLPLNKTFEVKYFIFMIIIVSSLGGNFFYNSSLAIYICAIKFYFEIKSISCQNNI